MKLPSSSSLLLATLAISSSSSTLAAPSGESDTVMTTSTSNHHISAFLGDSSIRDLGSVDIDNEQRATSTIVERSEVDLEADHRNPILSLLKLLHNLPIIGHPVASLIEKSLPNGTNSAEGMPDISPDDLKALQAAIAEVSRTLNQTSPEAPSAIQSVNGTAPTAMSSGDGLYTAGSVSNSFSSTSAALADATNTDSSLSRPSAGAADGSTMTDGATSQTPSESTSALQSSSSPRIPGNPPNSPVPSAA
ncbi:hypothetical protein BYT27DRAFT_7256460 [Phlegmacium glaucopus]|nr:hypothetical protein BYT27DRAFT_7256460 [Phlegmacium glaucopus]